MVFSGCEPTDAVEVLLEFLELGFEVIIWGGKVLFFQC